MRATCINLLVVFMALGIAVGQEDGEEASATATAEEAALAKRSECLQCHGVDGQAEIGPTFEEIAAKYRNDDGAAERLVAAIVNGSKGVWPVEVTRGVAMPPYSNRLSDEDIRGMADWILALETDDQTPEKP